MHLDQVKGWPKGSSYNNPILDSCNFTLEIDDKIFQNVGVYSNQQALFVPTTSIHLFFFKLNYSTCSEILRVTLYPLHKLMIFAYAS